MKRSGVPALLFLLLLAPCGRAQVHEFQVTVKAGKHDYKNVPVKVSFAVPKAVELVWYAKLEGKGTTLLGQVSPPGILTPKGQPNRLVRELHFILPSLKAGTTVTLRGTMDPGMAFPPENTDAGGFFDKGQQYTDFYFERGGKRANRVRYINAPFDDSTKESRNRTYKVFHHLFAPAGDRVVTNGGYADEHIADPKKLLYPHHRGLMFAYNRIRYGPGLSKKADVWHCTGDAYQSHRDNGDSQGGPVLVRSCALIDWHGEKKEVFAREERELTVYNVPGGTLVEFTTRLKTTGGKVMLDGDPQHAGFQFRAANDVAAKTAKQTYFLRPDGKGKPGETRNWDPKTKKGPVNLPWDAMSFVLDGKRYTAAYLNNPRNPGESRWSERDYGRFGCYFPYELTADRPLVATYRVWLQDGEMTGPQVEALHTSFASPPTVSVK